MRLYVCCVSEWHVIRINDLLISKPKRNPRITDPGIPFIYKELLSNRFKGIYTYSKKKGIRYKCSKNYHTKCYYRL